MATYGQLQQFQPEAESIGAYLERVDMYFLANDIAREKKVPVFLSVIGGKTFSLLRDLLAPAKPHEKSLQELADTLRTHYEPKPLIIAERFYFHQRTQKATETVAEYVAELRRLATNCEFGEFLNDALRDRLVCGLRNPSIQKRLLSEAELKLAKAVELAQGMEAADSNAKQLQGGEGASLNRTGANWTGAKPCYRCGGTNHHASACRFREETCHKCQKKGHLARVCRGQKAHSGKKAKFQPTRGKGHKPVRSIEKEQGSPDADMEEQEFSLFRLGGKTAQPIMVTMEVNNQPLPMEVDTGAAVSVMQPPEPSCFLNASYLTPLLS